MQEIYEFLKQCGTYYLSTMDGDQPRVRPFGTIDLFDGRLTIQTGRSKDVARQIFANPKIELAARGRLGGRGASDRGAGAHARRVPVPAGNVQARRRQHAYLCSSKRYGNVLFLHRRAPYGDVLKMQKTGSP